MLFFESSTFVQKKSSKFMRSERMDNSAVQSLGAHYVWFLFQGPFLLSVLLFGCFIDFLFGSFFVWFVF